MVYKLKTDAETRAYVQLLMNFQGVRTENIFNKVNVSWGEGVGVDRGWG